MNLVEIRKKLHTLAEVAHEEKETAGFIIDQLSRIGVTDVQKGIGGHGLIATISGESEGPVVMFRAELDALPMDEAIDIPYASNTSGVSHKCGHDGHITMLLGLAEVLQDQPVQKGKVQLLFQPAEETGEGAHLMLEDDKMSGFNPDYLFALHNLPGFPLHSVLIRDDIFAAGSSGLIVRLRGKTAHAAHPEKAHSPATAVAGLIQEWQSLPQSVIPFDHAGLLTVIHARIGEPAFGTTPGYGELMATIRAHDSDDLEKIGQRAVELAESAAIRWNLKVEHEWTEIFKPTRNHSEASELVEKAAKKLMSNGSDKSGSTAKKENPGDGDRLFENTRPVTEITRLARPFSWSEDFGRFTEKWPGALFGLGAGEDQPGMHNSRYDFPDELLETGILLYCGIIDELGLR